MNKFLLFALGALLLALPACQFDSGVVICEDGKTPGPVVTLPPTISALTAQLGAPVQTLTYDPSRVNSFTSLKGTRITIPANAFTKYGQPVTAPLELAFREVFSRADMVLSNMPTIAGGQLLESAGEVYLRAAKDTAVRMTPGAKLVLQVPTPATASRDSMSLFVGGWGGGTTSTCFEWTLNRDTGASSRPLNGGNSNLVTVSSTLYNAGLNWLNCDKFYTNPNPTTTVKVTVPGLNIDPATNTMVFAVFRTINGAVRICNFKGPNDFEMPGIPQTMPLSIVVIRTVDSKLYYGRQDATVQAGLVITPVLQETTAAALVDALNQL
ncbi:hypothetical protein [Hymenobacter chitinivorans]|uniref:Outer membrane protein assembly factor BamB n=1 Tax=Hymenobacter chitinivorans DSM 11115 TaxID=1121954 RepID=A0A2M9BNN8_9BACT|nr:hypothetical protein [Hymenobacter chitinivorans]PJJ59558.1 outer membrane protein assembly factor BamB [Hymenobacter chitinivorans DSM 11115]